MSIRVDLLNYLKSKAVITEIVGPTGVYWQRVPQSTAVNAVDGSGRACVVLSRIGGYRYHDLAGEAGLVTATFQIDCWADNPNTLDALAEAVRRIDGYGPETMGSTRVQRIRLISELDRPEFPGDGSDRSLDRIQLDFEVTHRESIPVHV